MAALATAALLVDLDGTLWDSASWFPEMLAEACGRSCSEAEEVLHNRPVARVLRDFGVSRARFAGLCSDLARTLVVFDGVADTLASIAARDIATGAVTNLPGWVATPILQATGLRPLLGVVVDYAGTTRRKPWPDPLLAALGTLHVPATATSWYVGDTADDATAAEAAGISFASAGYSAPGSTSTGASRVLSSFSEAEDLFPCD